MTRIINIAGNSRSGKTVIALNLGIALAQKGRDVILVDANLHSPDLANYSDVSPDVFLNEYLSGEKKIEDTIVYHPCGMGLIPTMSEDHDPMVYKKIDQALLSLIGKSEIILADSSSVNPDHLFSKSCDETIFVTDDDFPSILKSKDFIQELEESGTSVTGVVINKKTRNKVDKKHLQAILEKPILVEIPYDERIINSVNTRQPVFLSHPDSAISKALRELADLIDIHGK